MSEEKNKNYRWDKKVPISWYKGKVNSHAELWKYIEEFIKKNNINSIFEVGGGNGYVSELISGSYLGVEVNEDIIIQGRKLYPDGEFIYEDWLKFDVSPYVSKFDLFLSCATIEHCNGYEKFISNAIDLKPKFILISFFKNLNSSKDQIRPRTTDGHMWFNNFYSRVDLEKFLKSKNVLDKCKFIDMKHTSGGEEIDSLLVVTL